MERKLINGISYIKSSKHRKEILLALNGNIMSPTDISLKLGMRLNHVSFYLKTLKSRGIVLCLNESMKKGRLYQLTDFGDEICNYVATNSKKDSE